MAFWVLVEIFNMYVSFRKQRVQEKRGGGKAALIICMSWFKMWPLCGII